MPPASIKVGWWPQPGGKPVIKLTKLDNSPLLVNLETVKYAEAVPDTVIRFLNGDSVIVRESLEQIENSVIESKKKIFQNP
jgi:uncharacterized protein YlzI (FlbEa/FlbD family)